MAMVLLKSHEISKWTRLMAFTGATAALVIIVILLSVPLSLKLRRTTIKTESSLLAPGEAFYDQSSGLISITWDGPAGDWTSGSIHGLKLGRWLFQIDTFRDDSPL